MMLKYFRNMVANCSTFSLKDMETAGEKKRERGQRREDKKTRGQGDNRGEKEGG